MVKRSNVTVSTYTVVPKLKNGYESGVHCRELDDLLFLYIFLIELGLPVRFYEANTNADWACLDKLANFREMLSTGMKVADP